MARLFAPISLAHHDQTPSFLKTQLGEGRLRQVEEVVSQSFLHHVGWFRGCKAQVHRLVLDRNTRQGL